MFGTVMFLLGMPHMDISRIWVSSNGNTRVQINQQVSDNNNKCTVRVNSNGYSYSNTSISEKEMWTQMFTQQRQMYLQMADSWDRQGRDTKKLRSDLNLMEQKINKIKQDKDDNFRKDVDDLQLFLRQTIHDDIRSVILQKN